MEVPCHSGAAFRSATAVLCLFIAGPAGYACGTALFFSIGGAHDPKDSGADAPSEGPFESSGIALLGRVRLSELDGPPMNATDIWGYVAPSGREYALLGLSNGTAFVEVTDPANPAVVDIVPHVESCCSDAKVYNGYVYIVSEGEGAGLQIVDVSGIDNGAIELVATYRGNGLSQAHNIAINEDTGYAYVCGARGNVSKGGLFIVDLADPIAPEFVGSWSHRFVHDVQVVSYETGKYAGKEVAFAFAGGLVDARLWILDVTEKSDIPSFGQTDYPNGAFAHQGWLSEDRAYVYLNDEFDEYDLGTVTSTHVIDVRDLSNPKYLFAFSGGTKSSDHNLLVNGDFIYEANYTAGLRIFHAPRPEFAEEVGFFDTHPASNASGFRGAWGVYPFLPSGIVMVSDIENGLFILDPSEALSRARSLPAARTAGTLLLVCILTAAGAKLARRAR